MAEFRLAVFNTQPPHLYFGGVERRILETSKRLQTRADIIIYSGTKAGFKTATNIDGAKLVPLYSTDRIFPLDNWFFNHSLTKKVAAIDADVYEGHAVSGYGFPHKLKQLGIKRPFIHTVHGVLADEYEQTKVEGFYSMRDRVANSFMKYFGKMEQQTAENANLIVTISEYSLEKLKKYYGIDEGKVRIVPNGVDIEKFKPLIDTASAKHQFGLGAGPCVLFVGSLIPRKGLQFLVEAAKKIVRDIADVTFLIVGEGPLRTQLDDNLTSSKLSGNFRFFGNLEEDVLPVLYGCADVFVLPSIQEGQGIVLLEAQACGKPVVAFNIGGVCEAVQNGTTGLLVERGNIDGLADALLSLLSDSVLRKRMGLAGRSFVAENYTWELCAERMLKVYREALTT